MGHDGVDLRNDIGVQISHNGEEVWKVCHVCEKNIDLGDEVLYLFRQRGTASATSGYLHLSCLESVHLNGQTGTVQHFGRPRKVYAGRCICPVCDKQECTYVGLTKQSQCVGFHWGCVKDVRLSKQEVEEKRAKRAVAIPKKVIEVQKRTELKKYSADGEELEVSVYVRSRISGKLVSARCHVMFYDHKMANYLSEDIELFSYQKWQRKKGELRLTLILHWPVAVQKQVIEYFDELQDRYDERGCEKCPSEKTF